MSCVSLNCGLCDSGTHPDFRLTRGVTLATISRSININIPALYMAFLCPVLTHSDFSDFLPHSSLERIALVRHDIGATQYTVRCCNLLHTARLSQVASTQTHVQQNTSDFVRLWALAKLFRRLCLVKCHIRYARWICDGEKAGTVYFTLTVVV